MSKAVERVTKKLKTDNIQKLISMSQQTLQVCFLEGETNAKAPTRGSKFAAGYDLYASEDKVIKAKDRALIKTGISIAIPFGTYARVAARSGLAVKHGIDVGAGVVDYDYRGEVRVLLFNHSSEDFSISVGDRIAQLVLEQIATPEVEVVSALDSTDRGTAGFGSTGGFNSKEKAEEEPEKK